MRTLYSLMHDEQDITTRISVIRNQIAYLREKVMTLRSAPDDPSNALTIESCEVSIEELRMMIVCETEELNRCRHAIADYITQLRTDIVYPLGGE